MLQRSRAGKACKYTSSLAAPKEKRKCLDPRYFDHVRKISENRILNHSVDMIGDAMRMFNVVPIPGICFGPECVGSILQRIYIVEDEQLADGIGGTYFTLHKNGPSVYNIIYELCELYSMVQSPSFFLHPPFMKIMVCERRFHARQVWLQSSESRSHKYSANVEHLLTHLMEYVWVYYMDERRETSRDMSKSLQGMICARFDLQSLQYGACNQTSGVREKMGPERPEPVPNSEGDEIAADDGRRMSTIWGFRHIKFWKNGPGKSKEWRLCRYISSTPKSRRARLASSRMCSAHYESLTRDSRSLNLATKPALLGFQPRLPMNAQRHDRLSFWRVLQHSLRTVDEPMVRSRRFLEEALCTETQFGKDEEFRSEENDETNDEYQFAYQKTMSASDPGDGRQDRAIIYPALKSPTSYEWVLDDLGPQSFGLDFCYVDSVLGRSFRILRHLRTETHGEVYAIESLSGARYQAKAYTLRGVSLSQRRRRTDNLKKLTESAGFVLSLKQNGKKYCIYQPVTVNEVNLANDVHSVRCIYPSRDGDHVYVMNYVYPIARLDAIWPRTHRHSSLRSPGFPKAYWSIHVLHYPPQARS